MATCRILQLCLDEQRGTRIYKNIRVYFLKFLTMILVWSRRAITESSHIRRGLRSWKSQWTTDFSQNSGTYIVYDSHVTCSNSSFSLFRDYAYVLLLCFPLVTVHVHVLLVPHWLLVQAQFYGRTYPPPFAEFNHVHRSRWYSDNHLVDIIGRMKLSTTSTVFNTCRTWWHSGNHSDLINVSVNNIRCVQHLQVRLIYYTRTL